MRNDQISARRAATALALCGLVLSAAPVLAQTTPETRVQPPVKITDPKPGEPLNMLAEANLKKPRPKAPVDFTGVWTLARTAANTPPDWEFWPMPKLTPAGQAIYNAKLKADSEGKAYKDDTAECYPPGMPRFLTRVWPIQIMQYPTGIVMIQGFTNQVRWIFTDGRPHTDPEVTLPSYNGESIGRWDGKELVVDSINFEPSHHWIQAGVPVSEQLHIVERWKMVDGGKGIDVTLTMTDPTYWEGEWVNTKRFNLRDDKEPFETHCIYQDMMKLPSARPGAVAK